METNSMSVVYGITLYRIIDRILYVSGSEGVENPVERDLAFNVKYKLQRNLDILLSDYLYYQKQRTELIKKYGETDDKDDSRIIVKPENKDAFTKELVESINKEVTHNFKKLTPEEVNSIKGDIDITTNEMNIFIAYLVEDPELVNDLKSSLEETFKSDKDTEDTETEIEEIPQIKK